MLFNQKIGIKTRQPNNAIDKIVKVYEKYLSVRQNRHVKNDLQKTREEEFIQDSNDLCDLSLVNALDLLKDKPLVRNFLAMQREKGRPGSMRKILEKMQRDTNVASGSNPVDTSVQSTSTSETNVQQGDTSDTDASLASGTSSISLDDKDNSKLDPDYVPEVKEKPPPKKKKEELIDERIAGILDKCCISLRCAVHLIVAILVKLEKDPRDYKISASTIAKRRSDFREAIFDKVREAIDIGRGAVVHFDGKLMAAITGNEKVDRLAVKVTYRDVDHLIGNFQILVLLLLKVFLYSISF